MAQQTQALRSLFDNQYIHQCADPTVPKQYTSKAKHYNIQCACDKCAECSTIANLLSMKPMDLIEQILCDHSQFLAKKCIFAECDMISCGFEYISNAFKNRKCIHDFKDCILVLD
eukprot:566767_1